MNSLTADANYDIIKKTVAHYFPDGKVILFGSRARGEQTNDSDYDLLIVTENELEIKEKRKFRVLIHRDLLSQNIISDVLVNSENEIKTKKELIGNIVRYAVSEGVYL